ncbi:TPR-like protein [Phellopilus nigrolimitatus]|nr:TPR-like protein [Phellopilus nigrolimitatus]
MATDAQRAKERGNAAFKAENFPEAVGHYTTAILADSADPTFPLNRAAAYLRLGKNEDAERDCSNVLQLKSGHVKALFRRAQARIELQRWDEAKKDLLDALKLEPSNDSVKSELHKVNALLERPKKSTPEGKKIAIKPPPSQRQTASEPPSQPIASSSSSDAKDLLTPISSRPLQSKSEQGLPTPSPSPARTEDAHCARRNLPALRRAYPFPCARCVFNDSPQPSPLTLFDFSRSWELAEPSERWDLLCRIPPPALPSLFKISLESVLLLQILEVCSLAVSATGDPTIKARVRAYLHWFPRVPRFATVTLFLSAQEKELCKVLGEAVGAELWRI